MTTVEKILAAHSGRDKVQPGDLVDVSLDFVLANDVSAPLAIKNIDTLGAVPFDKEKVCIVMDHFTPSASVQAAEQCKVIREFAMRHSLSHCYDTGSAGIEHAFLPEQGLVLPGQVVVGGDSHTCTYGGMGAFSTGMGSTDITAAMVQGYIWMKVPASLKFHFSGRLPPYITGKDLILYTIGQIGVGGAIYKSMEFCGEAIEALPMDGRFAMCNMAVEAGAKNGIIAPDRVTADYVSRSAPHKPYTVYTSDPGADYEREYEFSVEALSPQVACPHLPSNTKPVEQLRGVRVDQVVIGSCTNGRMDDLRAAAQIMGGKQVHPHVRAIVIPATRQIYLDALREGLIETFIQAGAAVSTPTCGPCFGGHMGLLASGETALATTNRNFVGRMGHKDAAVYLASPYVAAATAITGRITHPQEVA